MKYISGLLLIAALLLVGCDSNKEKVSKTVKTNDKTEVKELSHQEKRDIILTFINKDIRHVNELEQVTFASLDSVSGEDSDEQTISKEITNRTIPTYEKVIKAVEEIDPPLMSWRSLTNNLSS